LLLCRFSSFLRLLYFLGGLNRCEFFRSRWNDFSFFVHLLPEVSWLVVRLVEEIEDLLLSVLGEVSVGHVEINLLEFIIQAHGGIFVDFIELFSHFGDVVLSLRFNPFHEQVPVIGVLLHFLGGTDRTSLRSDILLDRAVR